LFRRKSAVVNGTWTENAAADNYGDMFDTGGMTVVREITLRTR
jgi:hypothetical protein